MVLGSEHPDTLTSMANLACALGKLGPHDDSEKHYKKVVETESKIWGQSTLILLQACTI